MPILPFAMRLAVLALVVLAVALSGCGGDDDSEPASQAPVATEATNTTPSEEQPGKPGSNRQAERSQAPPSNDSGIDGPAEPGDRYDPSASDGKVHGDGSIEKFGDAADEGEAQEAVAAAVGFYDARAAGDWERACGLLTSGIKEQLEQSFGDKGEKAASCPAVMAGLAGGLPRSLRVKQAKSIRFTGFRVKDDGGYAIFVSDTIPHGFVPMVREDGEWRVAALSGSSL